MLSSCSLRHLVVSTRPALLQIRSQSPPLIVFGNGERRLAQDFFASVRGLLGQDPVGALAGTAVLGALALPPAHPGAPAPMMGVVNAVVNCPLAQRQLMLASLVNRMYPEANGLWGLGLSCACGWFYSRRWQGG